LVVFLSPTHACTTPPLITVFSYHLPTRRASGSIESLTLQNPLPLPAPTYPPIHLPTHPPTLCEAPTHPPLPSPWSKAWRHSVEVKVSLQNVTFKLKKLVHLFGGAASVLRRARHRSNLDVFHASSFFHFIAPDPILARIELLDISYTQHPSCAPRGSSAGV